ncbi:MAG: hypothetical protein ACXWKR_16440 [Phenylobacterium sp.]
MPIGREDAAQALKAAEDAAGRSERLHGYRGAAGFLILWGVVWAVMDVGYYLGPNTGGWLSLAGDVVGVGGSILLGARLRRRGSGGSPARNVVGALLIASAIGLFGLGISAVAPVQSAAQGQAIAGLAVGCVYMALGASQGLRLAAVGLLMVALTLGGWVYAREQFMLWMAFAGGGGLVLGGLWLRTA